MKALAVFSGGLDSMLAVELIKAQGIDVLGLFFETPFFSSAKARKSAKLLCMQLKVIDITDLHLEVVKNPKHGYGGNMNPCIDCHILMIKEAGARLGEENASFIITGEVLGQRPMSQNRKALRAIAKESGYPALVLRPLSAKLLPMTTPESKGWVRREELMGLSGRGRKPQMELAKRFGIKDYPSPAGGCLLTDPVFSRRLKDLLSSDPHPERREIELLRVGRHFRLNSTTKLVIGRNKRENDAILSFSTSNDLVLKTVSIPGPTALVSGDASPDAEKLALDVTASYSDAKVGEIAQIKSSKQDIEKVFEVKVADKNQFKPLMIQ